MMLTKSLPAFILAIPCLFANIAIAADENASKKPPTIIGRWDLTVRGVDGEYPSWLEVRRSGSKSLVGSYVGQFGSARPIAKVEFEQGKFKFTVPPQWERRGDDVTITGQLDGQTITGETTDDQGRKITFVGRLAPELKRAAKPVWGETVELFNGRDLSGWKPRHADQKHGWIVRDGILFNEKPGNDLMTEQKYTDFKLKAEFRYPKGSNSGIYLRGRYEVQIEDNYGHDADCHKFGGVYGYLTPSLNAAKKAGEWQTVEITLVGREVTVIMNGERIIDRQTIPGITGGALDSKEGEPGPLLIQGDHGPVEFRKVAITPAK